MSNPTRQEIIDAHLATQRLAELATHTAGYVTDEDIPHAYRDMILAALPPKPQPTMAEVEWDGDKHRLAEAEHSDYGEVIMLNRSLNTGNVRILLNEYGEFRMAYALPQNLTPTGRRYTLTEVQE